MVYEKRKIELLLDRYRAMNQIVDELEREFPGRHFTLDGHLVGSIGEVIAEYHYGVDLYEASHEKHDGIVDNRKVQIKITQRNSVTISDRPDYLLVLYLTKQGKVYEVYNGPGVIAWSEASGPDKHNNYHIRLNNLIKLDKNVNEGRLDQKHLDDLIEKMDEKYKNA